MQILLPQPIPERLTVRVTPKASFNRLKIDYQADGTFFIRAYVTVAPEDGKANQAVIDLLAKALSLPKNAFTIVQGFKSRNKVIRIQTLVPIKKNDE